MKKIFTIILLIPVRIYRLLISPLFPPKCIYFPSCSTYCIDALKKQGPLKGVLYSFFRILRCSPFFNGGVDPVEVKTTIKAELNKFKYFRRKRQK